MASSDTNYELQQIRSTLESLTERLAAATPSTVGGMQMYIAAGWSPIIALTDDGTYYYAQILDWTGGSGIKPPVLQYLCETGWTYNVAEAARVGIVGGGIPDGDKGDITVASGVWTIDNGVVTTAKMGGDVTTAGKALLDDADAAAQRTTLGLGTAATAASTDFAAASHTHALSDLTQSGATTGQVAQWNGTAWVPATAGSSVMTPRCSVSTTSGSTTTSIPFDNTIPQITEGGEIITLADVTPVSSSSKIHVQFCAFCVASTANSIPFALFDGSANAVAATVQTISATLVCISFVIPSWSGAKTLSIRAGPPSGTLYWLRTAAEDKFGAARQAIITATEIPAS